MIVPTDNTNLPQAAVIHAISWQESHRSFCAPDFVALHTPERQQGYIQSKMDSGSQFYLLIEDLYILPEKQNMGHGTKLLQFAVRQCTGKPTLWILENNINAKRLYHRLGFRETGRIHAVTDGLDEIELSLT